MISASTNIKENVVSIKAVVIDSENNICKSSIIKVDVKKKQILE